VSHDALYNQAAKFRYMFGGKAKAPLVMRGMIGAGFLPQPSIHSHPIISLPPRLD
jgi:pyruvate/2-oxoglutarate/acetoin dehydrogenase E1 component